MFNPLFKFDLNILAVKHIFRLNLNVILFDHFNFRLGLLVGVILLGLWFMVYFEEYNSNNQNMFKKNNPDGNNTDGNKIRIKKKEPEKDQCSNLLPSDYDYDTFIFPPLTSEEEHWEYMQCEDDYWHHENGLTNAEKLILIHYRLLTPCSGMKA